MADSGAAMREGDTPLIVAVRQGRAADVAALLAGGADVNEVDDDDDGRTPLYVACEIGHTEVVAALLGDADVNQAAYDGMTSMCCACWKGHTEIVTQLLAANAEVNQADDEGFTPLSRRRRLNRAPREEKERRGVSESKKVRSTGKPRSLFCRSPRAPTSREPAPPSSSYQLRSWSSGMMLACHAGDPGSIPGERKLLLIFWMPHRARRSPGYSELQNLVERCWRREMVPD